MSNRKNKNSRFHDRNATKNVRGVLNAGNRSSKYNSRPVQSSSNRYGSENVEEVKVEEEKMDDFSCLMNSPSDCNYFQFKSEKGWEEEAAYSSFSGHKFFNLDLDLLSNGLACIPFYERVEINKNILSLSDIEKCDKKAEDSLPHYNLVRDRFITKLVKDYELPQSVQEAIGLMSKLEVNEPQFTPTDLSEIQCEVETPSEQLENVSELVPEKAVSVENGKQNETEEENLEDWLDSVLDD